MPSSPSDRVSWVVPQRLRLALAKVAASHDRTPSAEARQAIEHWCKQHGVDPDAEPDQ